MEHDRKQAQGKAESSAATGSAETAKDNTRFTSTGNIPPPSLGDGAPGSSASELAFGRHDESKRHQAAAEAAAAAAGHRMAQTLHLAKTGTKVGFDITAPVVALFQRQLAGELNSDAVKKPDAANTAPGIGTPEFEAELDKHTGSKATEGNDAQLLFDGVNSFAERVHLIDQAKTAIELQTFIFSDDATGRMLAEHLGAAAQRGVKVRVIYDALGSQRAGTAIFDEMRKHGVEVRANHGIVADPLNANMRWHEKHLIVDGTTSIEGGMNIADEYAYGGTEKAATKRPKGHQMGWRDTDVKITGEAVGEAEAMFARNWAMLGTPVPEEEAKRLLAASHDKQADTKDAKPGAGTRARFVQHHPREGDNNTENAYLIAIAAAKQEITIEDAYVIPPPEMRAALIAAAKRGVAVRIMTNSNFSNDNKMAADASRYYYSELVAAGIEIREKKGATLHSKTMEVDGQLTIVGSMNLNNRSKGHDTEDLVMIENPQIAAAMVERYNSGQPDTNLITAKELKADSTWQHMKSWGAHLLAKTF